MGCQPRCDVTYIRTVVVVVVGIEYYYVDGGTLFTGSVMCFLSAWVLLIILDIVHMQTEELVLKRKLAS